MKLLWLDLETTGLDPNRDQILEVAAAVADLESPFVLSVAYTAVLRFDDEAFKAGVDPFVQNMHEKNGLWAECRRSDVDVAQAEKVLLGLVDRFTSEDRERQTTLAGSCVTFDLAFLKVHMPKLASYLHYRVYDVSSVALFCRSLGMPKLPKAETHRAGADVAESVENARQCAEWLRRRA